jgi:pimeloyl-ACP methyl ester carboxylesterase
MAAHSLHTPGISPALAHRVGCPVLVACGARSRVFPQDCALAFAGMFPHGRCVVIPDAGHNIQEDNPKALADEMRRHLAT